MASAAELIRRASIREAAGNPRRLRRLRSFERWNRAVDWFVPESLDRDIDTLRRARLAVYLTAFLAVVGLLTGGLQLAAGRLLVAAGYFAVLAVGVALPFVLRATGSLSLVAHMAAFLFIGGCAVTNFWVGGLALSALVVQAVGPMVAILIAGGRAGLPWAGLCCAQVVVLYGLHLAGVRPPGALDGDGLARQQLLSALGGIVMVVLLTFVYDWLRRQSAAALGEAALLERDMRQQLVHQEKLASVGQLAAGVAHEINNPLAYVRANIGYIRSELLADSEDEGSALGPSRADLEELLDETMGGIEQISRITGTLVQFSRRGATDPQLCDLAAIVDSALAMAESEIRKRAELVIHVDRTLPPLPCHAGELQQVLVNLLLNAAHAASEEGRVEVQLVRTGNGVELSVIDDGVGIERDDLERVFDPFFTTKEVGEGTGLGLAVSAQIVEEHGGTIRAESRPGVFTCFTVALPFGPEVDASSERGDTSSEGQG